MTMKALISKRTTRMPFRPPISAPMPSAIASETGKASQAGLEREPAARAAGAEGQRHRHRGQRHHRFDREVHLPGDQRQRQPDGDDADEGRLLEDVEEDADLEELRDEQPEARQRDEAG